MLPAIRGARDVKVVAITVVALALLGARVDVAHSQLKLEGSLKEILVKGSPWEVSWERLDGGTRGRFNQTFAETSDGSLTTRTDEVGTYETSVQLAVDGKSATWTSPHSNVIKLSMYRSDLYGEGRNGNLRLTYRSRAR